MILQLIPIVILFARIFLILLPCITYTNTYPTGRMVKLEIRKESNWFVPSQLSHRLRCPGLNQNRILGTSPQWTLEFKSTWYTARVEDRKVLHNKLEIK